jgi:hypothetical protein
MSSLTYSDKAKFEKLFEMSGGYVADFNDITFRQFFADFGVDIHPSVSKIIRLRMG